ncbi:apolipoprotein N-acyltransferase [Pelagibacterales bacterium SAG-MED13]|nr:apolipoprotein N-acyltransferase [Pelagibacterales bacterium SAG-MED13]
MTTSLSLPPFNYILVNFFTFTLFFLFLLKKSTQNRNAKIFFLYGWLFGFGYFVTNLYWISISLSFDQNFKFLIPFTVILIPAFLALFYGIVSYLFIILKSKKILSSFILFSLIFGIIEFIRGSIFTGFPWNLIVYSFSRQLEILSITSIIGTYGLNLFCISLFTSPSIIILKNTKKNVCICISFFIITGLFYFYGHSYKEKFYKANDREYEYKVRVIGSNINLDRFYLGADSNSIIKDLIKLSSPNKNQKTIFIWPEGILPNITEKEFSEYKLLFSNYFSEKHLLIIGVNNKSTKDGSIKYFNSLSIYNHEFDLIDTYNKINLVPFGEFLPFENVLKNIGLKSLTNNYQSFSSGNLREIIKIKKQGFSLQILPLICYEIIYSGKLISNPSYDLIVNISEDGWFGQSIGPQQHFDHSVLRAIENRKYILRSANNGIAAIINPLGIVEHSVDFGNSGYVELEETKIIQPTIFSIYGNKIFGLLILMYILLIFSFNKIRNE